MANSTAAAQFSATSSGSGTRDSDGNSIWQAPLLTIAHGMVGFSQFDVDNALSATINEQDLTALNLDGSGSKDLTGLYGYIEYWYISGSGTVLIEPGDTNGATWHATVTIGAPGTGGAVPYFRQPLSAGGKVTASLKTLDHTVSGTIVYGMRVFAGAST